MTDYERIKTAFLLAKKAHQGQTDKAGEAYIYHPLMVALQCETTDEKIVALLHDVVEDTDVTIEEIYTTFGKTIGDAINVLTHKKEDDYFTYIQAIKTNPLATTVKIADLTNNSDLERIKEVTQRDLERIQKYKKALAILSQEAHNE